MIESTGIIKCLLENEDNMHLGQCVKKHVQRAFLGENKSECNVKCSVHDKYYGTKYSRLRRNFWADFGKSYG